MRIYKPSCGTTEAPTLCAVHPSFFTYLDNLGCSDFCSIFGPRKQTDKPSYNPFGQNHRPGQTSWVGNFSQTWSDSYNNSPCFPGRRQDLNLSLHCLCIEPADNVKILFKQRFYRVMVSVGAWWREAAATTASLRHLKTENFSPASNRRTKANSKLVTKTVW